MLFLSVTDCPFESLPSRKQVFVFSLVGNFYVSMFKLLTYTAIEQRTYTMFNFPEVSTVTIETELAWN